MQQETLVRYPSITACPTELMADNPENFPISKTPNLTRAYEEVKDLNYLFGIVHGSEYVC